MEADSHASLRHKYAACALKASFLLLMSMHQSARTEVPQDKMPETPSGEESPVRHLVVKFTPLGGSYSWRISPAQLAMSVATLGKDRVEGSDGDQHVGCGTCALDDYAEAENETQRRPQEGGGGPQPQPQPQDEEEHDDDTGELTFAVGSESVHTQEGGWPKRLHGENKGFLESELEPFRQRVLALDDTLRKAVVDYTGSRALARQMFSVMMTRDGATFAHAFLQSALFDRLLALLVGKSSDPNDQTFLTQPARGEPGATSSLMTNRNGWTGTIRRMATVVASKANEKAMEMEADEDGSLDGVVASLLKMATTGRTKSKYLGLQYNLSCASLGLKALLIASKQGTADIEKMNLFDMLL